MEFHGVHSESVRSHDESEEFDFFHIEVAFLWFEVEIILAESLQYLPCPFSMGFPIFGEEEHVLHVNY